MRSIPVVLIIGWLNFPHSLTAQSIQAEVDSVSYEQFEAEVGKFLEKAENLDLETTMHAAAQKTAYNDFLKGKRKDLPDIYEAGGEKILLDSYSLIGQAASLMWTLEHLEYRTSKDRYRVLLAKYIELSSNNILALVEVQEATVKVKKKARDRIMKRLGLD